MAIIKSIVPDDLKEKIQTEIERVKRKSRGGVEVNMSTVLRYSLEKYLEEQKELDEGVITLKFNVNKLSVNDLKKLEPIAEQITEIFNGGYEDITMDLTKNSFDLDQSIKYKLYQEEKLMQDAANYELAEDEKKFLKTKED